MIRSRQPHRRWILTSWVLGLLLLSISATAEPSADTTTTPPTAVPLQWLVAGPQDVLLPLGHGDDFGLGELLEEPGPAVDQVAPAVGRKLGGSTWKTAKLNKTHGVALDAGADRPRVAWLAAWVKADRFTGATLKITSDQRVQIFVDGEAVAKAGGDPGKEAKTTEAKLKLFTGLHSILVKTLAAPGAPTWTVSGELLTQNSAALTVGTSPERGLSQDDLLDVGRYSGLQLSPDGRYLAVNVSTHSVPADHARRWMEILSTDDGRSVRRLDGVSGFKWLPDNRKVSYLTQREGEKGSDLVVASVTDGANRTVAQNIEDLSDAIPLPDGSGLLLELTVEEEADSREVKRYRALPDRWGSWRDRTYWVLMDWNGERKRLTTALHGASLDDLRPDGGAMLMRKVDHSVTERPFSSTTLVELDFDTLEEKELGQFGWLGDAEYSPDGSRVLLTGSPALFGDLGKDIGSHPIANDYDTQAYLIDIAQPQQAQAITRDVDVTVQGAHWSAQDGRIYFDMQDRTWGRVMRFDPQSRSFETLQPATDTFSSLTVADGADVMAYVGSSPNRPHAVFVQSTTPDAKAKVVAEPSEERLADVRFGKVEPWSFTSQDGTEVLGRVYYPADFDADKKYPLIVYYYGGTVPTSRSFGGRYPKELWAANGYVVYVPQPSGATGFGQEFSARHVNAWGRRTADEIIEGTQKFVADHDFIDAEKVGCTGASYGGFMTMYLQTRTDIYAAAISHAGISNLASYWGQGWWGYLYSAAASADSFPWNNPELYVGQSPLYAADKIQTPLLLLHGDADTNVPPVESHQMFTALKLLGKTVELIEIGGENHTILSYEKRKLWSKTILAWFDRWLKNQPEAWQELWGNDEKPKG